MIVAGSATQGLAAELAAETGRELAAVSYGEFPDGERVVQITGEATTTARSASPEIGRASCRERV